MTEYDYSPEAYDRYLATQNRIAKWVDDTEQHRPQFQPAVNASNPPKESSRRRRPNLYIHPPPSSDSEDSLPPIPLSAPGIMYAAPQPPYPGPPMAPAPRPLLSPPPMMQMVYPGTQRSPYYPYLPPANQHRSHTVRSSRHTHSPAYYSVAPSPQVSPAYPHPQQFFYPSPTTTPHPHPGYLIIPSQHPPQPPHQPLVYLRA
jgi:hypothetical protein